MWFRWYHVAPGDTLSGIALWWFGSGDEPYWRRIWLANRPVIGENPDDIQAGDWYKLPLHHGIWYHIEDGDTLSQLAAWVYGDGDLWWIIHQANQWIPDPNDIRVSWWIWIP